MFADTLIGKQGPAHFREDVVDGRFGQFKLPGYHGKAGQSDKGIAPPPPEPGIAGNHLHLFPLPDYELLCRIQQAMLKTVAGNPSADFIVI